MNCQSQKYVCSLMLLAVVFIKTSNGQAYNTYNAQYQSNTNYPANYQSSNYQSQSYQTSPCNDLLCQTNECCVETYKGPICVALDVTIISPTQANCARLKKCSSNADCPTDAPCCQIIPDITTVNSYPNSCPANTYGNNNYGNTPMSDAYGSYGYASTNNAFNSYGYTPVNGYGSIPSYSDARNFKNGYCRNIVTAAGRACFEPIDGVETTDCPCQGALVCTLVIEPFPIGTCQNPTGK